MAEVLAASAEVTPFPTGSSIVEESAPDNDLHFILAGTVSIRVFGREIAVITAGQHFGEMALLDPGKPRSASVVADEDTVTARIPATAFASLADNTPRLWKNVARTLADRLSQRNRSISSMNPSPVLFVGCSAEALPIGRAIQSALEQDPIVVRIWTDDTFKASQYPIESLELELAKVDFAALVLSPDDQVTSRNKTSEAPRDNLVFELGMFMGALGRSRTFLLHPDGAGIKDPNRPFSPDCLDIPVRCPSDKLRRRIIHLQPTQSHHLGDGTTLTQSGESKRMALGDNLRAEVRKILQEEWTTEARRRAPESVDLELRNDAVTIHGTVLYADMDGSTRLVDAHKPRFAAEIYKSYLVCAARIIESEGGTITAYDGDRIMAVYVGKNRNNKAVRSALKINNAVQKIINPAIAELYQNSKYSLKQSVGVDTSELFVTRTGIRGANDLVWVGRAANHAAKLSGRPGSVSQITSNVYDRLSQPCKVATDGRNMWSRAKAKEIGNRAIYTSDWTWKV